MLQCGLSQVTGYVRRRELRAIGVTASARTPTGTCLASKHELNFAMEIEYRSDPIVRLGDV